MILKFSCLDLLELEKIVKCTDSSQVRENGNFPSHWKWNNNSGMNEACEGILNRLTLEIAVPKYRQLCGD